METQQLQQRSEEWHEARRNRLTASDYANAAGLVKAYQSRAHAWEVKIGAIDGVPILDLDDHYLGQWDRLLKRGLDISAVLLGGVVRLPLWTVVSILIKIGSRGPVLFTQARVGEHGRTFNFRKFRTMQVVSEEDQKQERQVAYAELIERGRNSSGSLAPSLLCPF